MRTEHLFFCLLFLFLCLPLPSVFGFVDFHVNESGLILSNNNPIEGENITLNVTIHNLGNESANNLLVEFFDDTLNLGNSTVNFLPFSSASVIQFWRAEIGPHDISVRIDPTNTFTESNETNNNVAKRISISAYQTYVGIVRSFTTLGFESSILFTKETNGCNLLIADSDSNVDFSALQALRSREDSGNALDDFIDADSLLGMTLFEDSITATWDGKSPKKTGTKTLIVSNETISNVPIINSTNSTFFRTGILWDTSDDTQGNNGQFDINNKEDLVFIANINQSTVGKFGIYDYEIKIPALLRDYKPGSSTVDFFIDLDSACS